MKKTIFIVAGMPRSGTTFLHFQLQKHPKIFASAKKEMDYFSVLYENGPNWYADFFKPMNIEQIGLDASPVYFMDKKAVERIDQFDPTIKIVLGVRSPASWSVSLYNQIKSHTYIKQSFEDFLHQHDWQISGKTLPFSLSQNLVPQHLQLFQETFKERLLLYNFDYFNRSPLKVLQAIEQFLELPPHFTEANFENIKINAGDRKNIKLLSALLKNEFLLKMINTLFPNKLIVYLRNQFLKWSTPPESKKKIAKPASPNLAYALEKLDTQEKYVQQLFKKGDLVLGDGTVFQKN